MLAAPVYSFHEKLDAIVCQSGGRMMHQRGRGVDDRDKRRGYVEGLGLKDVP